jgi:two-component system, response regulator
MEALMVVNFLETKTILLIENNPDDEALLLRAFRRNNLPCRIVTARSGNEGLDYLFKSGEPDLILLDLKLPRLSGFEVLRRIRAHERGRFLPVVILSSSNEPGDIRRSYELGANSYLQKPLDLSEFETAIRVLAEYWLKMNQPPPRD